jgi:WD40 repeat protein
MSPHPLLLFLAIVLLNWTGLSVADEPRQGKEGGLLATPGAPRTDLLGDPLPEGILARFGTSRFITTRSQSMAFSPNNELLAVYNWSAQLRVWDLETGKERWRQSLSGSSQFPPRVMGGSPGSSLIAFSPDSKMLALCDPDKTIRLWNAKDGRDLGKLDAPANQLALAFHPSGNVLATASHQGTIQLWDTVRLKALGPVGDFKHVAGLAYETDGKTLVAVSWTDPDWRKRTFSLHQGTNGKERSRCQFDQESNFSGALSPDGQFFASASAGGKALCLIDTATGKEKRRTEGDASWPGEITFSGDGNLVACTSKDGMARIWDVATGKRLHEFKALSTGTDRVALNRDGSLLVVAGRADEALHLWDLEKKRERFLYPGHRSGSLSVAFQEGGKILVTASRDNTHSQPSREWADWSLRRWDAATGKELSVVSRSLGGEVHYATFSNDGSLLALVLHDGTLRLWDAPASEELRTWKVPVQYSVIRTPKEETKHPRPGICEPVFSPDGKVLYAAHNEEALISRWDVATGKELPPFKIPRKVMFARSFLAADGRSLLVTKNDDDFGPRFLLFETASGHVFREFRGSKHPYPTCLFSPDGRTIAVLDNPGVLLWEANTGRERGSVGKEDGSASAAAFTPDGRFLVVVNGTNRENYLSAYHLASGQRLGRLGLEGFHVASLVFSPDGNRLALSGISNTALVCDVAALLKGKPAAPKPLTADERLTLLGELENSDGARAYRAIGRLAEAGPDIVPALQKWLKGPHGFDEKRVARLIADLDSDEFASRDRATRELRAMGVRAEAALRRALKETSSAEVRKRLEEVLDILNRKAEIASRILEALERNGTADARQALKEIAAGDPGSPLAQEAKASLERLERNKRK